MAAYVIEEISNINSCLGFTPQLAAIGFFII